jgi:outer membrane lipoprotein SlyB
MHRLPALVTRSAATRTWVSAVVVALLLLQAALPWLASQAAQARGVSLVEVCTVYGVRTVALPGDSSQHAPGTAGTHTGDHCLLQALGFGPATQAVDANGARPSAAPAHQALRDTPAAHDATARWAALRKHGPPAG